MLLFACSSLVLTGCSTILHRGYQPILHVTSEPEGASISLDSGSGVCKTPCDLKVRVDRTQLVTAQLDGYNTKTYWTSQSLHWTVWLNFIFGSAGLLTGAVDYATDAMWVATPENLLFKLVKSGKGEDEEQADVATEEAPKKEPPYQRLPNTPPLLRMKEYFPETYVIEQVKNYYGDLKGETLYRTVDRLYTLLMQMEKDGERPDIDEAVRRDSFRENT